MAEKNVESSMFYPFGLLFKVRRRVLRMRAKNVPDKIVRQIAWNYVNYPYFTMAKLGQPYAYTREFVSKLLHRAIEECIVSDEVARKIMERAAGNSSTHAGKAGCAMVRKAFERSFMIRAKRKEVLQNAYQRHQEAVDPSVKSNNAAEDSDDKPKYVEPEVEQLSMFSNL